MPCRPTTDDGVGGCGIQSCLGQAVRLAGRIPVQVQFLHGPVGGFVGQRSGRRGLESQCLRVAAARPVVARSCRLGSTAAAGLPGALLASTGRFPVSPAFMQPGSRSQQDGAAWLLLVSSLFWSSLAPSSSSWPGQLQPGAGLSEGLWTVEVAALPGLLRSRGRTGPLGCLHVCDGV